jgi:hypothetical protein
MALYPLKCRRTVTRQSTHPANLFPAREIPRNRHHRLPPYSTKADTHRNRYLGSTQSGQVRVDEGHFRIGNTVRHLNAQ